MAFSRRVAGVITQRRGRMAMPPYSHFIRNWLRSFAIAFGAIGSGLFIGMTGYHLLGKMKWEDAFYYASMILSGEGPPPDPVAITGVALSHLHLFAGIYALFSGVTFITMIGVLFSPALHWFLHRFHLEISEEDDDTRSA